MQQEPSDTKRPGWYLIEKYMLHRPPEEQKEAYENLRELIRILIEIDDRLAGEHAERKRQPRSPLL